MSVKNDNKLMTVRKRARRDKNLKDVTHITQNTSIRIEEVLLKVENYTKVFKDKVFTGRKGLVGRFSDPIRN